MKLLQAEREVGKPGWGFCWCGGAHFDEGLCGSIPEIIPLKTVRDRDLASGGPGTAAPASLGIL